jgi:AcrR family transcriptional regulator
MSTQTRKYELKARAESQRETRDRIARSAAALHEEKGVAQTTVADIARRAGVTRLTVYNHFADLSELIPACSAHYETQHPLPDFGAALELDDPRERARGVLSLLYGWYRETETMFGKLFADRSSVPELDRFLAANIDRVQQQLAAGIARGQRAKRVKALSGVAVDFWTWRRLDQEGLQPAAAADVMAAAIASA